MKFISKHIFKSEIIFGKEDSGKAIILELFSYLGMLYLLYFSVLRIFENDLKQAVIIFFIFTVIFSNFLYFKKKKNVKIAAHVTAVMMFGLMFLIFSVLGKFGTGLYWFFLYPLVVIFLLGNKIGNIYSLSLITITFIFLKLPADFMITYHKELHTRVLFIYLVVNILTSIYEYSKNKSIKAYNIMYKMQAELLDETIQQKEEIQSINEELYINQSKIQSQAALAEILKSITEHNITLEHFLQNALEAILNLSWLKLLGKGAVFIVNRAEVLELIAQKGLGEKVSNNCKYVNSGYCLCGRVLEQQKTIIRTCLTHEHDFIFEEMKEHGHYISPLIFEDKVLGVLNLYVPHQYVINDYEIDFLDNVCIVLAAEIQKHNLKELTVIQAKEQKELYEELTETHKEITAGINYANSIQQSLMPSEQVLKNLLKEHFVLHLSRDAVSGDFYYAVETENKLFFTVGDCTGHGVAGAFISILGITFLNQIIKKEKLKHPEEILERLRTEFKEIFKQFGSDSKNGMDMALCVVDYETDILEFAGAYNSMYIIRNNQLTELEGTRNPIGIQKKEKNFEKQTFNLQTGDTIYLFSDGFYDQYGGENGKEQKFKRQRFKEMLILLSDNDMETQKNVLNVIFEKWKGNRTQLDDVTILGKRWKSRKDD